MSLTRVRRFTPDSMLYVDAARNVAAGRGLAISALGLNEPGVPIAARLPLPLTTYGPLYPLAIAALSHAGIEAADAALLVAALSWLAILLLAWALARRAWGDAAGLLAPALLLMYAPLRDAASTAWSEPLAVSLLLASLLALPLAGRGALPRVLVSGLCAGLAFATRYAFLPALALGPVALLVAARPSRRSAGAPAAWLAAAFAVVVPVLLRNHAIDGEWFPPAGPSTVPFGANLAAALRVLLGAIVTLEATTVTVLVGAALFAAALALTLWRGRPARAPAGGGAFALVGWTALYLGYLVVARTLRDFDAIDTRLVLPAGVTALIVLAGWLARGLALRPRVAAALLAVAMAWTAARDVRALATQPPRTAAGDLAASPRLTWLAAHTGERDLVFADAASDVVFYARRRAVAFWPDPAAAPPTPERLRAYARLHRAEYDRFWIAIDPRDVLAEDRRALYGPWFVELACGRDSAAAGVVRAAAVADGFVYQLAP